MPSKSYNPEVGKRLRTKNEARASRDGDRFGIADLGQRFCPGAEHALRQYLPNARVGDGHAITQFIARTRKRLSALLQVALDDHADQRTSAAFALVDDAMPNFFLASMLL